jgi:hypothetical protein
VLDDLNMRLNQRNDLLTTGQGLPADQYTSLVNSLSGTQAPPAPPTPPEVPTATPSTGAPPQYSSGTPSTGAPTVNTSGGEMARYPGGYSGSTGAETGSENAQSQVPPYPAGNYTGGTSTTDLTGTTPDYGVNTASSPSSVPSNQAGTQSDIPGGDALDSSSDATGMQDMPDATDITDITDITDTTDMPGTPSDKPQQ